MNDNSYRAHPSQCMPFPGWWVPPPTYRQNLHNVSKVAKRQVMLSLLEWLTNIHKPKGLNIGTFQYVSIRAIGRLKFIPFTEEIYHNHTHQWCVWIWYIYIYLWWMGEIPLGNMSQTFSSNIFVSLYRWVLALTHRYVSNCIFAYQILGSWQSSYLYLCVTFDDFDVWTYHDDIMTWTCSLYFWPSLRADSRFVPTQWETALLCNDVSHWLGASLESALQPVP